MKRKTSTHREYFQFQNKINAIIAEYDISELESFHEISRKNFPHLAEIIREMLFLAKRGRLRGGINQREVIRPIEEISILHDRPIDSYDPHRINESTPQPHLEYGGIIDLLSSRKAFKTNKDLGKFAKDELNIQIGWDWDSRENLVKRIIREINSLSPSAMKRVLQKLEEISIRSGETNILGSQNGFIRTWERIISDQIKRRE